MVVKIEHVGPLNPFVQTHSSFESQYPPFKQLSALQEFNGF